MDSPGSCFSALDDEDHSLLNLNLVRASIVDLLEEDDARTPNQDGSGSMSVNFDGNSVRLSEQEDSISEDLQSLYEGSLLEDSDTEEYPMPYVRPAASVKPSASESVPRSISCAVTQLPDLVTKQGDDESADARPGIPGQQPPLASKARPLVCTEISRRKPPRPARSGPVYKDQVVSIVGEWPSHPKTQEDRDNIVSHETNSRSNTRVHFASSDSSCSDPLEYEEKWDDCPSHDSSEIWTFDGRKTVWMRLSTLFRRPKRRTHDTEDDPRVQVRRSWLRASQEQASCLTLRSRYSVASRSEIRKKRSRATQQSLLHRRRPRFCRKTRSRCNDAQSLASRILRDSFGDDDTSKSVIVTSSSRDPPSSLEDVHVPQWPISTVDPPIGDSPSLEEESFIGLRDPPVQVRCALKDDKPPTECFQSLDEVQEKSLVSENEDSTADQSATKTKDVASASSRNCYFLFPGESPITFGETPSIQTPDPQCFLNNRSQAPDPPETENDREAEEVVENAVDFWEPKDYCSESGPGTSASSLSGLSHGRVNRALDSLRTEYHIVSITKLQQTLGTQRDELEATLACVDSIHGCFDQATNALSNYVVLDLLWLDTMRRAFLRSDWGDAWRNVPNLKSSDKRLACKALFNCSHSNCPLITETMLTGLWLTATNSNCARKKICDDATADEFALLRQLFVHRGELLHLGTEEQGSSSQVYLVPALLLDYADDLEWSFRTRHSYMTSICHLWQFQNDHQAPTMDCLATNILQDFRQNQLQKKVSEIKLQQLMLWKSAMLLKIGMQSWSSDGKLTESPVELFVALQGVGSCHGVATYAMPVGARRVVVCGKGNIGHHGRRIWDSGLRCVVATVKRVLSISATMVEYQIVCPKCLTRFDSREAGTFDGSALYAQDNPSTKENADIFCPRGHPISPFLLTGTFPSCSRLVRRCVDPVEATEIVSSVVLIMVWDPKARRPVSLGSGFVVDAKRNLLISAAHTLYNLDGKGVEVPGSGLDGAKVMIGIVSRGRTNAVFRYSAEVVAKDLRNVDAVVLQVTHRLFRDVCRDDNISMLNQPMHPAQSFSVQDKGLATLHFTDRFVIDETCRLIGFNQGGEGILPLGTHVSHAVDVTRGFVCGDFEVPTSNSTSTGSFSGASTREIEFCPRREIVLACTPPTISGQSGSPCVNNAGLVIGILSRADVDETQRTYLVPAAEFAPLVAEAQGLT